MNSFYEKESETWAGSGNLELMNTLYFLSSIYLLSEDVQYLKILRVKQTVVLLSYSKIINNILETTKNKIILNSYVP